MYHHMLTLEKELKRLETYRALLQESIQEIPNIYQSVNVMKHQFNSCLNPLPKPDIALENSHE